MQGVVVGKRTRPTCRHADQRRDGYNSDVMTKLAQQAADVLADEYRRQHVFWNLPRLLFPEYRRCCCGFL